MTKAKQEAPGVKLLAWEGDSKKVFDSFPEGVQDDGGFQLDQVQRGRNPNHYRPMPEVGAGTSELIVNDASGWFRVFYVMKFGDCVHVLHSFQKKTNQTSPGDIEIGQKRYKVVAERYAATKKGK
jgi:phage-related protein